jgi:photosystem II stability/assembly factor-like uncharacterized protein
MILDKSNWERFGEGFGVIGGAIGFDNTRYCFVLEELDTNIHRDPLPTIRLLFARMERPLERRFFRVGFNNIEFPSVASARTGGLDEFVGVDLRGNVMVYNDVVEKVGLEQPDIDPRWHDGKRSGPVSRVKRVNGRLYAVCRDRRILERKGQGQWAEFPGLERPAERLDPKVSTLDFGFVDMDAFSETDVYAVGGKGDVWHYDGKEWRRRDFPSNEWLDTVCCAGDGEVYVSGNHGSLWVGSGDTWRRICAAKYTVSFNDTVWFADRLWCVNDYALYNLGKEGLEPADVPPSVQLTTRRLDVSADRSLMLSAGKRGASLFDGKQWQLLFDVEQLD